MATPLGGGGDPPPAAATLPGGGFRVCGPGRRCGGVGTEEEEDTTSPLGSFHCVKDGEENERAADGEEDRCPFPAAPWEDEEEPEEEDLRLLRLLPAVGDGVGIVREGEGEGDGGVGGAGARPSCIYRLLSAESKANAGG